VSPVVVTYERPTEYEFSAVDVSLLSPSSPNPADAPALRPDIPAKSAAECHSKPILSAELAQDSDEGAEFKVVPVTPVSPPAAGTVASLEA